MLKEVYLFFLYYFTNYNLLKKNFLFKVSYSSKLYFKNLLNKIFFFFQKIINFSFISVVHLILIGYKKIKRPLGFNKLLAISNISCTSALQFSKTAFSLDAY